MKLKFIHAIIHKYPNPTSAIRITLYKNTIVVGNTTHGTRWIEDVIFLNFKKL